MNQNQSKAAYFNQLASQNQKSKLERWFNHYYEDLIERITRIATQEQYLFIISPGSRFDIVLNNEDKRDILVTALINDGFKVRYCMGKYFSGSDEPSFAICWRDCETVDQVADETIDEVLDELS